MDQGSFRRMGSGAFLLYPSRSGRRHDKLIEQFEIARRRGFHQGDLLFKLGLQLRVLFDQAIDQRRRVHHGQLFFTTPKRFERIGKIFK